MEAVSSQISNARFPAISTVSTVSSPPRAAEFAVVITVRAPSRASAKLDGCRRSPMYGRAPRSTSAEASEPFRTRMRTSCFDASRRSAIMPPSNPVAPTSSVMISFRAEVGGWRSHQSIDVCQDCTDVGLAAFGPTPFRSIPFDPYKSKDLVNLCFQRLARTCLRCSVLKGSTDPLLPVLSISSLRSSEWQTRQSRPGPSFFMPD